MTKCIAVFATAILVVGGWTGWNAVVGYERVHAPGAFGNAVDLKTLGAFPFDPETGTTADVPVPFRNLDGKRISVEGFMFLPTITGDEVSDFRMVYDINSIGGWHGPPRVQEWVFATVKSGKVPFASGMVKVIGTLHVGVTRDLYTKRVTSVYRMDVDAADPL